MKKVYITAGLLLTLLTANAQNKKTEKADQLFESYQYVAAIEEYIKLADAKSTDGYVYKQLADSYYNIHNTDEAAKWYAKAVTTKQNAETYYHYAQVLKSQGKYQESNAQMDKFASLAPTDQRAKDHKANPDYMAALAENAKLFNVLPTKINSKDQSDFGPFLTNNNQLYFVSTRNSSNRTDKWNDQPYLDIYEATRNNDGSFTEPKTVSELNSAFHDGPVTISTDGKTMFFARDGHTEGKFERDKKNKVKVGQQGLYKAVNVNGKWSEIVALPFNSKEYSVSHPSLSKDGKTLYFASNMPGGLGDTDIWKVSVESNSYGKPVNLGPVVNTSGKEGFPFITEDNVLYFSSLGKQGFGGLDVYKLDLGKSTEAINVGKPVNSEKDDFSFSFNTVQNIGYFSSNTNGTDDIYAAIPICKVEAIAHVNDKKTGKAVADATVTIVNGSQNAIETKRTNANGEISFEVNCDTEYTFQASKKDYDPASRPVAKTKSGKVDVSIDLDPVEVIITDKEVILKNVYFEFNKSNITDQGSNELDKLVKVMNDYPAMVIFVKSHTDSNGSAAYNMKLSEQRAQATVQYVISKGIKKERITGKGFGFSEPKVDCGTNCTDEQDAQNRRSEFIIVKK